MNYTELYETLKATRKKELEALYEQQVAAAMNRMPEIEATYNDVRGDAYQTARKTSIGNNEALAATGLAGNLYSDPKSGYSESSRVADNNAMRNALNAANRAQAGAETAVYHDINALGFQREAEIAAYNNKMDHEALTAQQQQEQWASEQRYKEEQAALQRAFNELSVFGKIMTQAAADAIGLPVGTTAKTMTSSSGKSSTTKSTAPSNANLSALMSSIKNEEEEAKALKKTFLNKGKFKSTL